MKERGNLTDNTVVTTIMSNFGLYKAFDDFGINYKQTDVGDRFVYECMRDNGHLLGGEQSGHIIFGKYASTGDGVLTAIKVMQALHAREVPLSKLAEPVMVYPQVLRNIRVKDKQAALDDPQVVQAETGQGGPRPAAQERDRTSAARDGGGAHGAIVRELRQQHHRCHHLVRAGGLRGLYADNHRFV
jgi:phosphomannomutase